MGSSSSAPHASFSLIRCPITEKFATHNFPLWKAQVLSALRGAQVAHYLDAEGQVPAKEVPRSADKPTELVPNPEYATWVAKDQQIFNYLLSNVSREIQVQVSNCTMPTKIWKVIQDMTSSQSRGQVINTRMALATAQKGSSSIAEFFSKMKSLADDMVAAGKKLEDEEIASYILDGLDSDFNPVVSAMAAQVEPLSLDKLYTQLVSWEQRMDLLHGGSGSSTNVATRCGRGGF